MKLNENKFFEKKDCFRQNKYVIKSLLCLLSKINSHNYLKVEQIIIKEITNPLSL